jgi:hypothetical protein
MLNGSPSPLDHEASNGSLPEDDQTVSLEGEFVSIGESLVVSPSPGRFRRELLEEGARIEVGTVIGRVAFNGGSTLPIVCPVAGVFLGWLAWEGESLQKGTLLARLGIEENGSAATSAPLNS